MRMWEKGNCRKGQKGSEEQKHGEQKQMYMTESTEMWLLIVIHVLMKTAE